MPLTTVGWPDLAEALVGPPGTTTPLPAQPAAQRETEDELLRRLVDLNAQRAAEKARKGGWVEHRQNWRSASGGRQPPVSRNVERRRRSRRARKQRTHVRRSPNGYFLTAPKYFV